MISKDEKEELLRLARSSSLREDMRHISSNRHNPLIIHGRVDMDRLITFLTEYNELINHRPKPFKKIIDRVMKL